MVLVLDEGNGARQVLEAPDGPVRAVVVGVIDELELLP
jgi:microcompartment protein CcmK/EutM